jgi:3-oxoacyl-[acyl-carrier-protein] synthase II
MNRSVVITGLAPIAACGIGKDAFWAGLRAARSPITKLTRFEAADCHARCAGEVNDFDPAAFFPPHRLKRLDRYAQFSLAAALLALEDAGLPWSKAAPTDRIGVSWGTALGGICDAEREHALFLKKGPRAVNPTLALQIFGGSAHANIAIECGFRGPGTTNSNSCASGAVALGEAFRYLRDGMADVMLAGAGEAPLCPLTFSAFDFIKTMSRWPGEPALACRPFDTARDGFVMGEGAAALVLETRAHATRRGARIYAEVCGYGLTNDAFHMTTPLASGEAVVACMTRALADAGLAPGEIDYINAHASSTQANDANELECIRAVCGTSASLPAVSGTKPFTAHPLGAAGALEAVICALALHEQWLPPTLHLESPDPAAAGFDLVPRAGRPARLRAALNNSFGFGGINACVALRAI